MKKDRPKIQLELDAFDRFVDMVGKVCVILLIGLPLYYYGQLPESIPTHYDASGTPDSFSHKGTIWILTIIGALTYGGLYWLNKYPHLFNYAQPITPENAEWQYKNATRMLRSMNAIITCSLAYVSYSTIQTALGNQNGLGAYFLPIFLVMLFGAMGYYVVQMTK